MSAEDAFNKAIGEALESDASDKQTKHDTARKDGGAYNISKHGYSMHLLVSALQKCIRRGGEPDNERDAYWIAYEMCSGSKAQFTWTKNRLICIANEDIGVGDLQVVTFIHSSIDLLEKLWVANKEWDLLLGNMIISMCRAKKAHDAVHLALLVEGQMKRDPRVPKLIDCARDMHTAEGRKMGRGWEHFMTEGFQLTNEVPSVYREAADAAAYKGEHNGFELRHDFDSIPGEPTQVGQKKLTGMD